jgi:hypothetical protein
MFKDSAVQMDTVFGDGSASGQSGGFMDKLLSAGKRVITGESLFTTMYTHSGSGKAKVAFAAPYPGTVMAMKLDEHGGKVICQKDSFLAGARGRAGRHAPAEARSSPACSAARASSCRSSKATAGCSSMPAAAWSSANSRPASASMSIPAAWSPTTPRSTWTCARGRPQEHVLRRRRRVPGHAHRPGQGVAAVAAVLALAGRMLAAAPQNGGARGEGSVLGGLGRILDGDNSF